MRSSSASAMAAWQRRSTCSVTVTNSNEGIVVRRLATGLNQPMMLAPIPGNNATMFLIERGGAVYRFTPSTGARVLVTTVPGVTTDGERGLLGIAPRPDFATTGESSSMQPTARARSASSNIRSTPPPSRSLVRRLCSPSRTRPTAITTAVGLRSGPTGCSTSRRATAAARATRRAMRRTSIRGSARSCAWR